jgi:hypothetical protein
MSDNEPDRIESATHNTFQKKMDIEIKILRVMSPTEFKMQPTIHFQKKVGYFRVNLNFFFFGNVLWFAFSIPSGSLLSLFKCPVYHTEFAVTDGLTEYAAPLISLLSDIY